MICGPVAEAAGAGASDFGLTTPGSDGVLTGGITYGIGEKVGRATYGMGAG
jgi:hypothetical protein